MNQKQEYKKFIIELATLFQPDTYVEIGARFGYVFNTISTIAKRSIAVDIIPLDKIAKAPGVECYQMDSQEFAKQWKDPIDLLFIDADHKEESVLYDFSLLSKFVKPHTGLILLHDTYPVNERLLEDDRCSDAWKAASKIHRSDRVFKDFEIVTLPGPWAGLSIIRKVYDHHGWMDERRKNEASI